MSKSIVILYCVLEERDDFVLPSVYHTYLNVNQIVNLQNCLNNDNNNNNS